MMCSTQPQYVQLTVQASPVKKEKGTTTILRGVVEFDGEANRYVYVEIFRIFCMISEFNNERLLYP